MSRAVLTVGIACLLLTGTASGASAYRILESSTSSGEFAITSTSASANGVSGLYMRGYGRDLSGFAVVGCSRGMSVGSTSTTLDSMQAGRLYRLKLPFRGGSCQATASLSGSGRIRLQLLR